MDLGSVRAAVLLGHGGEGAREVLLSRLEERVEGPDRHSDAGDVVAARALARWPVEDTAGRLAALAVGPSPHPDLEVRVGCAATSPDMGRDEAIPFLLRVLHAGTPAELEDPIDWTPTTTKSVVLQTLATNPADIDAVWTSGSESRLVTEAFVESGRAVPLVTGSISGDGLGYWNENPDGYRFTGQGVLPVITGNPGFRTAIRILEGQGPKLNTLLFELPKVTQDGLGDWHSDCMTSESATLFPVPPEDPYPPEMLDAYFEAPAPLPAYDYSTTPDPCG